jgi:hypothetical protein
LLLCHSHQEKDILFILCHLCEMYMSLLSVTFSYDCIHVYVDASDKKQPCWTRVLLEKLKFFQIVKKFPAFLEPEDSFPRSEKSVPGRCPDPNESSPHFLYPVCLRSILTL